MNAPGDEAFAQSAKRLKMDDTVRMLLVSVYVSESVAAGGWCGFLGFEGGLV